MQVPNLAQFAPLHKGRSFICYRDVNKAIERHREIYGLRLLLKKAIKLENYCLTVDQMRDLNFRLKYGELDYQCSVDNGRPGRPGKDERCPRLVRLRLSPDARTLVVYDTHIHEPMFNSPSQVQGMSPPYVLQGPHPEIPLKSTTPTVSPGLSPVVTPSPSTAASPTLRTTPTLPSPSQGIKSSSVTPSQSQGIKSCSVTPSQSQGIKSCSVTPSQSQGIKSSSVTPSQSQGIKSSSVTPSQSQGIKSSAVTPSQSQGIKSSAVTPSQSQGIKSSSVTPTTSPSYEKITVKLKKSQFSPNEMVVVGSARDAQEQFELRNTPEKTYAQSSIGTPKFGDKSEPAYSARQLVEKLKENKSTTIVFKPIPKAAPHVVPELPVVSHVAVMPKPLQRIAPKPPESNPSPISSKTDKVTSLKVVDKDGKSDKKTGKPVLVRVPQKILPKPPKLGEKVMKQSPKSLTKPSDKTLKGSEKNIPKQNDKVLGKPLDKNINRGSSVKAPVRLSQRCIDKNAQRSSPTSNGTKTDVQRNVTTNGASKSEGMINVTSNGTKTGPNGKRIYRKKKTRQSEPSFDIASLLPLDTELGFNEKTQLAHGVLLRLLRVTSQLPMIEFTHALDTLEMLADAFKLEQKVNLTISQGEEETKEEELKNLDDEYYEEYYNFENEITSIGDEHRIALAQVDGALDDSYNGSSDSSESSSFYHSEKRRLTFSDDHSIELQHKMKMQKLPV